MLEGYGKPVKKEILALSGLAYEREMNNELAKLMEHFRLWESGKLRPFELSDLIHHFHDVTARHLYKTYCMYQEFADILAARALATGLIRLDEVSAETIAALKPRIEQVRAELERDRAAAGADLPADE